MKLSSSRLKYKEAVKKIVPEDIGLPCNMPFGRKILFHHPPGSPYIVLYVADVYMKDRKVYLPKWILTPNCLDKRYKIREVEVNTNVL